ncbi:MAG: BrnA antitoxin family protein [Termitinemataceae bacterium]|nr:MAG: BrnA antitoxin family protein [Termitinemataceae bacterium]
MALITKTLLAGVKPTDKQLAEIENASRYPISFTADSPQLTDEQLLQFKPINTAHFKIVPVKRQITLKVDADVLDFFKNTGKGYQTRINNVLRQAMTQEI